MKKRLYKKHRGATLTEYALLVALVAVICVAAIKILGTKTSTTYYRAASAVGT